ncbi:MAG: serine/threonine protein kinase [Deltaproteobacteria bacterium]|nr:serine/threonine protein kinase [Deltaproteobacteria bacterium]
MVRLGDATTDEEARAYLQSRLTALWKVMFWAFVILITSQWVMYEVLYPSSRPLEQDIIYVTATCGLVILAVIWRGVLVRRTLAFGQLYGLDMFFAAGCGVTLSVVAVLAYDFQPAHYVCLIYGVFVVFTRAIVVPSTGRWTALTSTGTLAPLVAGALVLALIADVIAPGPMFFVLAAILAGVTTLLATTGSRLIYGLRRQVTAAMQLGQYTLDRKIGEGGMGAVYRAHHLMLRRPTAVKLLLPERVGADNLERFEREVQHMSQLTHPNTVAVYDYGRSPDGVFYYAMEYLGGGIDLERLVRTRGPQPSGRVAHILAQVCGALHEAHCNNIIHRDIKPANIILCERGGMPDVAKVVDFGLVKEITTDTGSSAQVILGTPAYVAPEAVTDPNTIGPAVDLYALGAVGYFMLTGRRVFEGKTAVDMCIQHVTAIPRRPSEVAPSIYVAPELEAIVMRCLAKNPADRFPSADDMAAALRVVIGLSRDWSNDDARVWWSEFRLTERMALAASTTPTRTMPVDLGSRSLDVRNA